MGFPGGSVLKNPPAKKVTWVRSLEGSHIGKIKGFPRREESLEKEMATHSSILAWKSHGQRSLVGYSPGIGKELDMTWQLNNNHVS